MGFRVWEGLTDLSNTTDSRKMTSRVTSMIIHGILDLFEESWAPRWMELYVNERSICTEDPALKTSNAKPKFSRRVQLLPKDKV